MPRDWSQASDDEILGADVFVELGLDCLPEKEQATVLRRFSETVDRAILLRVIGSITDPAKQAELESLVAAEDSAGAHAFIETNVPNHPEISRQELITFKRVMLTEPPEERELDH